MSRIGGDEAVFYVNFSPSPDFPLTGWQLTNGHVPAPTFTSESVTTAITTAVTPAITRPAGRAFDDRFAAGR